MSNIMNGFETLRQQESFYSAIAKRLNLQSIGEYLFTGCDDLRVNYNNFREREANDFSALEKQIIELCGNDKKEKIIDSIMEYSEIAGEIKFSLGMKAGATLHCKLTDNFETDI